ncbi:Hsp20 family protein [Rhizobium halophytocola]|uniref:HSP20 family molecular chaperone IbpA n=1 Tax=Rhizobium halophytocola TaxID=735519 RepID=A0ABS4E042_9HYPH|nr:Hsp20 family protein [Rhizobium halophytocola]MBP1851311.1 HSP20 family molecular chaperone IbpA [Rhizobium halophytocola]
MGGSKPEANHTAFHIRIGFDLDRRLVRNNDGYPPYDIERILGGPSERLRITLAVAGFDESELDLQVAGNQLTIRGRQLEQANADYLFQGIAARQFQKVFLLAPGLEVVEARLSNGLLKIDLHQPDASRMVRKINISPSP